MAEFPELVGCPALGCDELAEVVDDYTLPSTDGPVRHIATACVRKHHVSYRPEELEAEQAILRRARELEAAGPDEYPFGYYLHLAREEAL